MNILDSQTLDPFSRESACSPIGVSLISDLFPPDRRGTANGVFHWGIYFGFGLSYVVGVYMSKCVTLKASFV